MQSNLVHKVALAPQVRRRPTDLGTPWNEYTETLRVLRTISHRPGARIWHAAVLVSLIEQRLRRVGLLVQPGPWPLARDSQRVGTLPPLDLLVEGSIGVYVLHDPRPDGELLQLALAACSAGRRSDATEHGCGLTNLVIVTGWRPSSDLPTVVNGRRIAWVTVRDQAAGPVPAEPKRARRTTED